MIISVASGKGGTGKTTIAASLAFIIPNSAYIDCDVEEPNGHLMLNPEFKLETNIEKSIPVIDISRCNFCNRCADICEYNAIMNLKNEILVFEELCHSCGACAYFCPQNAITETGKKIGIIRNGFCNSENIPFSDGLLNIGEPSATAIIKKLKSEIDITKNTIIDSPPGTACSMVETVKDSDYCILVTEPTPFGLHDLILAIDVIRILNIPFGVIINKFDLGFNEINKFLEEQHITVLQRIPFKRSIAESYSKGILPVSNPVYKKMFLEIFQNIRENISRRIK
jgi:MinD superfamily P-loop ATPase